MTDGVSLHQTRQPPQVERVQLVGGPCDGQRMFAVPGSTVALYVGLMRSRLEGRRRRGSGFFDWMSDPEPWEVGTHGALGHTVDRVQLAIYSPRDQSGLWVPYLGFDGIVSIDAIKGDGPFPPDSISYDEEDPDE